MPQHLTVSDDLTYDDVKRLHIFVGYGGELSLDQQMQVLAKLREMMHPLRDAISSKTFPRTRLGPVGLKSASEEELQSLGYVHLP